VHVLEQVTAHGGSIADDAQSRSSVVDTFATLGSTERTMYPDGAEIVRAVYAAAARRDAAAVLALYDPDVELDASAIALGGLVGEPIRHGHEGVRSFFRELHEAYDALTYDLEELVPLGDRVISFVTRRGRGRLSGVDVEMSFAIAWTVRRGRIVKLVWFASREQAREAVAAAQ
jgi:ketosteroid isomerase-like protein